MDDVQLKPVKLEDLSTITHSVFVAEGNRPGGREFLVIRYEGKYRPGHAGSTDALYIVATAEAACKAWWAPCTVLDLRELEYTWGDEMEWITQIGWDPVTQCHAPLAIAVGPKCAPALRSLPQEGFEHYCVDSLEAAFSRCREMRTDWDECRNKWHSRHETKR